MLDKSEKYFVIDFRTHTYKVTIDRLKSAQLSLDTLNQDAFTNPIAMSSSTQPPYTLDRDTYATYMTLTGRSVRRPIALLVNFANRHKLVIFSCGTKPVLVNAIVSAAIICFVYSLSRLDILGGGGEL